MELTPTQQKKLEHLAKYADDKDLATLEHFLDIEETLNELKDKTDLEEIKQAIKDIEIPEQIDHTAHMEEMMNMLKEPMEITAEIEIV